MKGSEFPIQTPELGQHGKGTGRNVSRSDEKKPHWSCTPMKLTGILTLISKLDHDQKTLGYLYCSVVAGEGISWPQRVVPLIPSSLLLSGSILDRQHKSRCCSSSAELVPCSRDKHLVVWHQHYQDLYFYKNTGIITKFKLLSNSSTGNKQCVSLFFSSIIFDRMCI